MGKHRESPIPRTNPSGKKVWVARYTGPDGRRRSAGTFKLLRLAQDAIDDAYTGDSPAPLARDTLGAYARDWTERYPRSERTNKTNDGRIRAVLDVEIGEDGKDRRALRDWPLADLRRKHALELVDHMLRVQGRASTGATNILRALSALAEDANTDELMAVNPFKGVTVRGNDPRVRKPRRKPRVLSWEQMHTFAAAAARPRGTGERRDRRTGRWGSAYDVMDPWRAAHAEPMIRMLGDCGLRIGELFALQRDLQDLNAGVFVVSASAWDGGVVGSSEEKEHDRMGPIPPTTLTLLRGLPRRIHSPWLFATPAGKLWRIDNFYRDVWSWARETSGIDATPHDFRHSWVSNLSAAGIDVADLADIAGHSVEVAQAHYRHALKRSFDQVRSVIG